MATARGVAGLAFVDEDQSQTREEALADMTRRWPAATFVEDQQRTAPLVARIFETAQWQPDQPVRLVLIGTDFEVRVWETLLKIPLGRAVTYADIARHLGQPTASRAVGTAVGRNPISFVVPCHRVLRGDGNLGGYHWGLTRKRALIGWETGRMRGAGVGRVERRAQSARARPDVVCQQMSGLGARLRVLSSTRPTVATIYAAFGFSNPRAIIVSAIWMALSAAPFSRLSETIHITRPFSTVASSRMRDT